MSKPASFTDPCFTDVIVAVHGIGEQSRSSTVRSVATRLAGSKTLIGHAPIRPISRQPLGYFHSDIKNITLACLLDEAEHLTGSDLASIGFAEVYWADIPSAVVDEGRTLEETKAWARTVVARAHALCERGHQKRKWLVPPDFPLAGEVLNEIIETVYVLENLTFLADKAGLFKFEIKELLAKYLGDVQLFAEFRYYRTDIVARFHAALKSIHDHCVKQNPDVRLHIVAHSEGTVVSFLGLLHAMFGREFIPSDAARENTDAKTNPSDRPRVLPEWIKHLHGYMTIGSPIDKHLLLWPHLWKEFEPVRSKKPMASSSRDDSRDEPDENQGRNLAQGQLRVGQIRWRNYYDYGDPVGFKLDTARAWLRRHKFTCFEFCGCPRCQHDIGYARYLLPGAAHNDYWHDAEVFEHFVRDVVKPRCRSSLVPDDILDAPSLSKRLQGSRPSSAFCQFIHDRLSPDLRDLLSHGDSVPESELRSQLAADLNRLIETETFFESGRIKPRLLSKATRQLLPQDTNKRPRWTAEQRCRANRAILSDVFRREIASISRPASKTLIFWLSPTLPYLLSFLILWLGVFVIYRAVHYYTHPDLDPLQKYILFMQLGISPRNDLSAWERLGALTGFAGLIAGTTLLARFPRLAAGAYCRHRRWPGLAPALFALQKLSVRMPCLKRLAPNRAGPLTGKPFSKEPRRRILEIVDRVLFFLGERRWFLVGILSFLTGCWLYLVLVPFEVQTEISGKLWKVRRSFGALGPTLAIFFSAALAGLGGYLVTWRLRDPERQKRWLFRGTRPLLIGGALAVAFIIYLQLSPRGFDPNLALPSEDGRSLNVITNEMSMIKDIHLTRDDVIQIVRAKGTNWLPTLKKVHPVLSVDPPVWPVLLSGAAFLYLWWLSILLFDLAFVWQRYVRRSTTNDRLREWNYKLPLEHREDGNERCCNAECFEGPGPAPVQP